MALDLESWQSPPLQELHLRSEHLSGSAFDDFFYEAAVESCRGKNRLGPGSEAVRYGIIGPREEDIAGIPRSRLAVREFESLFFDAHRYAGFPCRQPSYWKAHTPQVHKPRFRRWPIRFGLIFLGHQKTSLQLLATDRSCRQHKRVITDKVVEKPSTDIMLKAKHIAQL